MNYIQILSYAGIILILAVYQAISRRRKSRLIRIPIGLFICYFIIELLIPIFWHAGLGSTALSLSVAAAIVLWMAIARLIVFFVFDYFFRQKRGVVVPSITRDFGLAIAYIVIAMIVLKQRTNVNLGSLLTTSAILTAVIGFAMQDTLGNLFSGLALQVEHPYQIDDWIGFDNIIGKVVGITWKSTKILTRSEEMVFVPNNTIAKSVLTNYSRPTHRHITFIEIGVSYDVPPEKAKKAIVEVVKNHPKVLSDPAPKARVVKYDNFSVNYKTFFATEDFANEEATKTEILNDLWYKFRRCDIKIPYPIQEEYEIKYSETKKDAQVAREAEVKLTAENLSNLDIFSSLSDEIRRAFARRIETLEFAANEKIVEQGGEPGPMYIIKEGICGIFVSHDGGAFSEVAQLKPMQFFGEMSVLTGTPRSATVRAISPEVVCYKIEKDDLMEIFVKAPEALSKIGEILVARQHHLDAHRNKLEESAAAKLEQQNQLISKIKNFFGL